jgi:hypothetical protein
MDGGIIDKFGRSKRGKWKIIIPNGCGENP